MRARCQTGAGVDIKRQFLINSHLRVGLPQIGGLEKSAAGLYSTLLVKPPLG